MKTYRRLHCSRDVYEGAEVSPRKCRSLAVVVRHGRGYCRKHDPKAKASASALAGPKEEASDG